MSPPVSVRLDEDVRAALAKRRARIWAASAAVADRVAAVPEVAAFYDFWGTPGADVG